MANEITTNEVLSVKLDFMQKDIAVIKGDVKEIKSDFVSRREFAEKTKEELDKNEARFKVGEDKVGKLYSIVYWFAAVSGLATFASLAKYIYK